MKFILVYVAAVLVIGLVLGIGAQGIDSMLGVQQSNQSWVNIIHKTMYMVIGWMAGVAGYKIGTM